MFDIKKSRLLIMDLIRSTEQTNNDIHLAMEIRQITQSECNDSRIESRRGGAGMHPRVLIARCSRPFIIAKQTTDQTALLIARCNRASGTKRPDGSDHQLTGPIKRSIRALITTRSDTRPVALTLRLH